MPGNEKDVYTLKTASQELIDTAQNGQFALAMIEQIKGGTALRAPLPQLTEMIDALLRGVPYLGYNVDSLRVFRGRIEGKPFLETPAEFSYKPEALSREFGRCHRPGTTVFYGASNLDTVLSELTPEIGDRVHVGVARVAAGKSIHLTAISEIDHVRRYGRPLIGNQMATADLNAMLAQIGDEARIRALLVDAFFADLFAQPATKQRDYKATAVLAGLLLDARDDSGRMINDGFAYPSVGHRGGLNFAIHPQGFDRAMEWEHFMVFEITDYLGFGLYAREQVASASRVQDGVIQWENLNE